MPGADAQPPDVLPRLRADIEFHRGPDEHNGAPTYVIHDPLRGTFEKSTWVQGEVLRRLRRPLTVEQLVTQLRQQTTLRVEAGQIRQLCADAVRRGLTTAAQSADERTWLMSQRRVRSISPADVFLRLAFLRIPLIHPDELLGRTVGVVRHLGRPAALALYSAVGLLGVVLLIQHFGAYANTWPYFFNWSGALVFAGTIVGLKVAHEFSHAYVAKALGNRVPTMGVTLIFLFPVAYADVTDSWRMRDRRARLRIALAGVLAELVIAAFALVGWALAGPGVFKSVCFVVSSATLISTLFVNLNPIMRFDGYYVISDLIGVDNLQSRSFAVARWALRRHLLGLDLAPPEPGLSRRLTLLLVAYASGAWAYRLFLYSAIAVGLYLRFTKVVGLTLLLFALYTFLIRPVASEVVALVRMRRALRRSLRAGLMALGAIVLLGWLILPLPRWHAVPAAAVAADSRVIYAPGDGILRELQADLNQEVHAGDVLLVLENPQIELESELARLDVQRVQLELELINNDPDLRPLLLQKTEELGRAAARRESARAACKRSRLCAAIDGRIVEWDASLRLGQSVGHNQVLGRLVGPGQGRITAYVPHDWIGGVAVGDAVWFVPDANPRRVSGEVVFVERTRTTQLAQHGLASTGGGPIAVDVDRRGRLLVRDSCYAVEVALEREVNDLRIGQTGRIWLRSPAHSYAVDLGQHLWRVLLRESSF